MLFVSLLTRLKTCLCMNHGHFMHNTEILNDKPKQQQQIISNKKQQTQIDQNTIMNETKSNLTIILH